MWDTMKSNIQNEPNQVRMAQPIRSMDNYNSDDDKKDVDTEHLCIYRKIWLLINLLAIVLGLSAYKEVEVNFIFIFAISMICIQCMRM